MRPHIYRTHDGGRTWQEITKGLPDTAPVNTVREDPVRKGLLFAGTEREVFVSFNDGDEWQSLRLNMPATSIRDLVIHNDDLVVGTHGRSFWILDDITPLRQLNSSIAAADAFLFAPQIAYRIKRNVNTDTPLPPDEPMGQNPPDGAIINYYLKADAAAPVVLEIYDAMNKLVRRFSSADAPMPVNEKDLRVPIYWVRPPRVLPAKAGMQRFVWDLHYPLPRVDEYDYPISANYMDTPPTPQGPEVMPGNYTLKLIVNGQIYTQPLVVKIDPRVTTPLEDLQRQFALSMQTYDALNQSHAMLEQSRKIKAELKTLRARGITGEMAKSLDELENQLNTFEGTNPETRRGAGGSTTSLTNLSSSLVSLLEVLQSADAAPTTQTIAAAQELQQRFANLSARWDEIKNKSLPALNERLRRANLPALSLEGLTLPQN